MSHTRWYEPREGRRRWVFGVETGRWRRRRGDSVPCALLLAYKHPSTPQLSGSCWFPMSNCSSLGSDVYHIQKQNEHRHSPTTTTYWRPDKIVVVVVIIVIITVRITRSSAVAKRPRDVSCLSVVSFNSTKRRAPSSISYTLALDLPLLKLNYVLSSSTYSLVRGFLCRKQTCTVTVIHHWTDHRQLIALALAGIDR